MSVTLTNTIAIQQRLHVSTMMAALLVNAGMDLCMLIISLTALVSNCGLCNLFTNLL